MDQLLLEGRTGAEPQELFMRYFVLGEVLGRRKAGPVEPAGGKILAAIADDVEKGVVGFRNLVNGVFT